ncbi:alpha/beta hydrolase [Thalassomonas sp. RHCl1]|uniref:alpha/beta hydrolase n=1 Tax=Thalassomonas sp. RHCl1 TaxID=2995320 RepID=UPI00248C1A44|nr:alpha/beta hydrolase [Thalassomonas sp. RHCl1]
MYTKLLLGLLAVTMSWSALAKTTLNTYPLPSGIKVLADLAYGRDAKHTLDVYIPADAKDVPVIFMVHGGAWQGGDKAIKSEVENKIAHWVTRGFILVSTNYRTLPQVGPVEQTKDIAAALFFAQERAYKWGGSAEKFLLMGHSSGAHLVSLVSANYHTIIGDGIMPWLGTISLDISGYDIVKKVIGPNPSEFYKKKFGENPDYLKKASPFYALTDKIPPFLAICSRRSDDACTQAENFIGKAKNLGTYAELLPVDLSHGEINSELGKDSCYTKDVDDFLKKLSSGIASMLTSQTTLIQKNCAGA